MATTLRLTVLTGPHQGTRFCTRGLDACMVGRASECAIRFCGETRDLSISRHHCQLLLDTASVRVQDMDSANGTYINGHRVGDKAEATGSLAPVSVAEDGDILTIGGTSLQVRIMDCSVEFTEPGDEHACAECAKVKKDCPVSC